ncbi:MAG: hypothetical protein ACR2PL_05910, partial [Dehalococcoidia bacterium]
RTHQRMPDIMHLVKIQALPEQVYPALTTAEGIHNPWTRDVVLAAAISGTGEFGFFEHQVIPKVRVEGLKPAVHVGWKTISSLC